MEEAEQQARSMMLLSLPQEVATWDVFLRRVQSAKECPGWPQIMMQERNIWDLLSEARAWTATPVWCVATLAVWSIFTNLIGMKAVVKGINRQGRDRGDLHELCSE